MSDHHPDYDEIDRLERELFPEWFENEKPPEKPPEKPNPIEGITVKPTAISVETAPVSEYHGHSTEARKNPNWKPSKAVLLDKQPAFTLPFSASAVSASAVHYWTEVERDTFYGPRLRRVGE